MHRNGFGGIATSTAPSLDLNLPWEYLLLKGNILTASHMKASTSGKFLTVDFVMNLPWLKVRMPPSKEFSASWTFEFVLETTSGLCELLRMRGVVVQFGSKGRGEGEARFDL